MSQNNTTGQGFTTGFAQGIPEHPNSQQINQQLGEQGGTGGLGDIGQTPEQQIAGALRILQTHTGIDFATLQAGGLPGASYQPLTQILAQMRQDFSPIAAAQQIGQTIAQWSFEQGGPQLGTLIIGQIGNSLSAMINGEVMQGMSQNEQSGIRQAETIGTMGS